MARLTADLMDRHHRYIRRQSMHPPEGDGEDRQLLKRLARIRDDWLKEIASKPKGRNLLKGRELV